MCAAEANFVEQFGLVTERIGYGEARVRLPFDEAHTRPGGTISGPAMMALADFTMYAVVLGMIGPVKLAVTTSLNINFLRRPGRGDIVADGRILKLGKRLAVGEIFLTPAGDGADPVAHVTATYSIPPPSQRE
ncbi:MAG: PaaI family thioesterase [Alphaproteobacteria bacterium]